MPAIITHDFFGRDLYRETQDGTGALAYAIGPTRDERDAFLLGNQGPDPLFFVVLSPRMHAFRSIGSLMHDERPTELLCALKRSADILPASERGVARAYLAGFVGHYALDSSVHPLVFAQEYAICDAGIDGLTREDGSEVHAVIEGEFDEAMLHARTGLTVAQFSPEREILQGGKRVLSIVSRMYCYAVLVTYGISTPPSLFTSGVAAYRRASWLLHSRSGLRRTLLGNIETLFRRHSFYRAMSHRAIPLDESSFENRAHDPWANPFTGATSTASFADLFEEAKQRVRDSVPALLSDRFTTDDAAALTHGLNFSGKPAE